MTSIPFWAARSSQSKSSSECFRMSVVFILLLSLLVSEAYRTLRLIDNYEMEWSQRGFLLSLMDKQRAPRYCEGWYVTESVFTCGDYTWAIPKAHIVAVVSVVVQLSCKHNTFLTSFETAMAKRAKVYSFTFPCNNTGKQTSFSNTSLQLSTLLSSMSKKKSMTSLKNIKHANRFTTCHFSTLRDNTMNE